MVDDNNAKSFLNERRRAYCEIFESDAGQLILKDLAFFCRAHSSTYHSDARMSDILEGRRETFLRIQHHLQLNDTELWELYR